MSPEEELYDLACQDMPVTRDEVREALDKFKRAYAHELAEEIRAAAGDVNYGDAASAARHAYAEEFASIIEPEVPGD